MYCNSTVVGSFFTLLDTVATYECVASSFSWTSYAHANRQEKRFKGCVRSFVSNYNGVSFYCSSILCSLCAVPVWCKSVGNLNLGTLDCCGPNLLYVLFCQAFSTSWCDKKGSFNICNLLGVFFPVTFFLVYLFWVSFVNRLK